MLFQCLFKNPKLSAFSIFNLSAADPPQDGQQLHWPAPQGGRHQRHQFCWHGKSTHRCLSYCLHLVCIWKAKQPEMILLKILDLILDFDLKNLEAVWSVSRSKRRAAHKIKLGKTSWRRKSLCIASLRASSCSNFHRLKMNILYGKIVWLKLALIWITIFILSTFRSHDLFQDRLLSHWTRSKLHYYEGLVKARRVISSPNYRN